MPTENLEPVIIDLCSPESRKRQSVTGTSIHIPRRTPNSRHLFDSVLVDSELEDEDVYGCFARLARLAEAAKRRSPQANEDNGHQSKCKRTNGDPPNRPFAASLTSAALPKLNAASNDKTSEFAGDVHPPVLSSAAKQSSSISTRKGRNAEDEVEVVQSIRTTFRPSMHVSNRNNNDEDDELSFLGTIGTADFPHSRENCVLMPLIQGDPSNHCKNCYCYVCDIPAKNCQSWNLHCRAQHKDPKWKRERGLVRRAGGPGKSVN
jgi:hypothetical protein